MAPRGGRVGAPRGWPIGCARVLPCAERPRGPFSATFPVTAAELNRRFDQERWSAHGLFGERPVRTVPDRTTDRLGPRTPQVLSVPFVVSLVRHGYRGEELVRKMSRETSRSRRLVMEFLHRKFRRIRWELRANRAQARRQCMLWR